MIPAQAATQKIRRPATCRSYSGTLARRCRMTNPISGGERDHAQAEGEVALVGHRGEVDGQDQRADQDDGQDAAEVVDRVGRLVDVARDQEPRQQQRDHRERQRDQEDRPPPELLEQGAGDQRPERGDATADRRPQRDRLRPSRTRPQGGDQRQRRRIRHAGGQPAEQPGERTARRRRGHRRRAGRPGSTAPCRGGASACGRSGRRPRRGTAPTPARPSE